MSALLEDDHCSTAAAPLEQTSAPNVVGSVESEFDMGLSFSRSGSRGKSYHTPSCPGEGPLESASVPTSKRSESLADTSSSICRLGDLVNGNEARDKYRIQTRSPSDGDDVRWYFGKVPLSLSDAAASVPSIEVIGKNDYFRFSMRDSRALEDEFLECEEELLSAWWKEYAECSEGPVGAGGGKELSAASVETESSSRSAEPLFSGSGSFSPTMEQYDHDSDEVIGVPVKGGLYEVDLFHRRCYPVYWRGEHRRVLRGHWFAQKGGLDWLPLREDISEQLEFAYRSQIWHRRTFQPSGQFAARVNLQGATQGLHALFTGEDDTWEAWLGVDATGISLVLGLRGSGIKLRRGFAPSYSPQPTQVELRQRKEEEMDDYCSQVPVRHLVFMVHGIGQRLEKANLVDDVGTFRHTAATLAEQHLTEYQRNTQRVLFIPCQWRRGLKLGGEDAVEKCTLEGVRALRTMLSATVHDVLYYMSPVYCQDIIDSVSRQLNRLYYKFIKRNPGYNGKVSIYGHSLGSVLSYDILCHQNVLMAKFPADRIHSNILRNDDETVANDEQSTEAANYAFPSLDHGDEQPQKKEDNHTIDYNGCPIKTDKLDSNDSCVKEVEALKAEVAFLKDKLKGMEEGHCTGERPNNGILFQEHSNGVGVVDQSSEKSRGEYRPVVPKLEENTTSEIGQINLKGVEHNHNTVPDDEIGEDCRTCFGERVKSTEGLSTSYTMPKQNRTKDSLKSRSNSRKRYTPYIEYTKLAFEVDTFFAVGSPIGVFLALRNVRLGMGIGKDYWQDEGIEEELPACRQMLNIFHPFDPVAYRIEPLVCKENIEKRPVFVPYHRGGKRLHIGMQELGEDLSARSKALVNSISTVGTRVVSVFSTGSNDKKDTQGDAEKPKERTYGSLVMERLTGSSDGRIDYMLQDATFEHQYIQAISSHTAYWQDPDTALFIIKHLYCDIPEEPSKPKLETDSEMLEVSSVLEPIPLNPRVDNESADEEVAFTFSSKEDIIAAISKLDKSLAV